MYKSGILPSRNMRWCTRILKIAPVGRRASMPDIQKPYGQLIGFDKNEIQRVRRIRLNRNGIMKFPLVDMGLTREDCASVVKEENLSQRVESPSEYTKANDPVYIGMYNELRRTADMNEVIAMSRDMEKYALEQHWTVMTFPISNFTVLRPSIKGYSGEYIHNTYLARLWKEGL